MFGGGFGSLFNKSGGGSGGMGFGGIAPTLAQGRGMGFLQGIGNGSQQQPANSPPERSQFLNPQQQGPPTMAGFLRGGGQSPMVGGMGQTPPMTPPAAAPPVGAPQPGGAGTPPPMGNPMFQDFVRRAGGATTHPLMRQPTDQQLMQQMRDQMNLAAMSQA